MSVNNVPNKTHRNDDKISKAAIDPSGIQKYPSPSLEISVVIPLFNEVDNIRNFYDELVAVLNSMDRSFEIIIIDDGSTDGSFELLSDLRREDSRLRVIRLRRNFGQTSAFAAGFDAARAEWVITMDADSQNDPADIPALIAKAEEGYDVVSGWRRDRHDALLTRKIPSVAANWLISRVTGVRLHDSGCAIKVYNFYVVKNVKLYGELHRFIPAAASGLGIRVAELPVNHRTREIGQSKYSGLWKTASRTIKVFLDLLTLKFLLTFVTRPIHMFGSIGLLSFGVGISLALYLSVLKLILGQSIGDRPL